MCVICHSVADFLASVQLGLNHLADHTHDEYRSMLGYRADLAPERSLQATPFRYVDAKPPPSMDWREKGAVTPVKNQAQVKMLINPHVACTQQVMRQPFTYVLEQFAGPHSCLDNSMRADLHNQS